MTTTVLNKKISEAEKKIPDTRDLVTTTVLNTKISEVEIEISDNSKYITTQEFNKLTAKNFVARIKEADLVNRTDRRITSNKTKNLEIQKKLNRVITKDCNYFLCRIYFTSNNGSQNTFVYQPKLDTSELKKRQMYGFCS